MMGLKTASGVAAALFAALLAVLVVGPVAAQVPAGAAAALPVYDGGGNVDELFFFDLTDGRGELLDRGRREPRELRSRPLGGSLFAAVGRPADQPAPAGEIHLLPIRSGSGMRATLFVEASTGYVAYLEDLGKGLEIGAVGTTLGRPFQALASTDANYALLARRDGSGRTRGAYLYHATTGRGLYAEDLFKLDTDLEVSEVTGLPASPGAVTALALEDDDGETLEYLLLESSSGRIHFAAVDPDSPRRLNTRSSDGDVFGVLPREASAPPPRRRFELVGLRSDGLGTHRALVIDAATGRTALVEGLLSEDLTPGLRPLTLDLAPLLPATDAPRRLAAVAAVDGGDTTHGAWVIDAASDRIVYLDGLEDPYTATAGRVRVERP